MSFSIETDRLVLEDFTGQDLPGLRQVARDPDFLKYVLIWLDTDEQIAAFPQNAIDEANRAEDRPVYILAVRVKDTGAFAGLSFIEIDREYRSTAEIGIALLPAFCRNGHGPEILDAYIAFGFGFGTLGMHRVYGNCDEQNIPSARLMERCGLMYEGTIREHVWLRDHGRSTKYFGMLAGEYAPGTP